MFLHFSSGEVCLCSLNKLQPVRMSVHSLQEGAALACVPGACCAGEETDFTAASVTENVVLCGAHFRLEDYVSGDMTEFRWDVEARTV